MGLPCMTWRKELFQVYNEPLKTPYLLFTGIANYPALCQDQGGIAPIGSTGRWRCLTCLKEFSMRKNAIRHYHDQHLTTHPLICQFCNFESKNSTSLMQHIRTQHGVTVNDLKKRIVPGLQWNFEKILLVSYRHCELPCPVSKSRRYCSDRFHR